MSFVINNLFAITILNYLFYLVSKIDSGVILEDIYQNISNDLGLINAPFNIIFTYFIFTVPISILFTAIHKKYFAFDFEVNDIEILMKKIIQTLFVNLSVLTFFIYFFRIYELLSRFYVLVYLLVFPIIFFIFNLFIHSINSKLKTTQSAIVKVLLIIPFLYINFLLYGLSLNNNANDNRVVRDNAINAEISINNLLNDEYILEESQCSEWKGSGNIVGCVAGLSIIESNYDQQITNMTIFEDRAYFIFKNGLVYVQSSEGGDLDLFLDISKKVFTEFPGMSQGLYSIAFNPSKNNFLVSYSNDDIALVVEEYQLDKDFKPIISSGIELLKISNNVKFHFGGSLIWSNYFQGFLFGIGDMRENIMPLVHSDALNTTSFKGKIILLKSERSLYSPLINEHGLFQSLDNIVAYGLRNPWQLTEYKNNLYITDVGSQFIEELNQINYDEYSDNNGLFSTSFGWPLLMGDELSYSFPERNKDALTKLDGLVTDLYYWEDGLSEKADNYIVEKSKSPLLYYDHFVNDSTIRAAIIGGDFLTRPTDKYNDFYFFTDYVENELYGLDVMTKDIIIFPLPDIGNPTSLKASPFNKDSLLIAFSNGKLLNIKLP
jgi:hypothetical protein